MSRISKKYFLKEQEKYWEILEKKVRCDFVERVLAHISPLIIVLLVGYFYPQALIGAAPLLLAWAVRNSIKRQ